MRNRQNYEESFPKPLETLLGFAHAQIREVMKHIAVRGGLILMSQTVQNIRK